MVGQNRHAEAIESFRRAVELDPKAALVWNDLGNAMLAESRLDEAVEAYNKVLELQPGLAMGYLNLALARDQNRPDEALEAARRCLRLDPTLPEARVNLGMQRLRLGAFEEGFQDYEWRWRLKDFPPRSLPGQLLDRGFLGRENDLFLHQEQGFGETWLLSSSCAMRR